MMKKEPYQPPLYETLLLRAGHLLENLSYQDVDADFGDLDEHREWGG